jgi:hypothetical protein
VETVKKVFGRLNGIVVFVQAAVILMLQFAVRLVVEKGSDERLSLTPILGAL